LRLAPQHLLSLSRLVLGALVLASLRRSPQSPTVLPAIILACVADYFDGAVARRAGTETVAGRLLDNCCDAGFLALAFAGFANAHSWSTGASIMHRYAGFDWWPLLALAASFGTYVFRWLAASMRNAVPRRSPRGHHAGIANYVLALVGSVVVFPSIALPSVLVGAAFAAVTGLNVIAALDNVRLLASGRNDAVAGV
jgi:phosphatidylglycerophosphate synthase